MKISTIFKHASSQRFEAVKSFYMHTRGRKSSQVKKQIPRHHHVKREDFSKMKIRKMSPP
jgi:hypothetical protein